MTRHESPNVPFTDLRTRFNPGACDCGFFNNASCHVFGLSIIITLCDYFLVAHL